MIDCGCLSIVFGDSGNNSKSWWQREIDGTNSDLNTIGSQKESVSARRRLGRLGYATAFTGLGRLHPKGIVEAVEVVEQPDGAE